MSKLTPNQTAIINSLKLEFQTINSSKPKVGGLIDVQEIIDRANEESNFLREINLANRTFRDLKLSQIKADAESLADDLDALGLKTILNENSGCFYITPKSAVYENFNKGAYMVVNYENTHHIKRELGEITRHVDSQYGVKFNTDSYSGCFKTFADAIKTQTFKDKLKYVYQRALEKK